MLSKKKKKKKAKGWILTSSFYYWELNIKGPKDHVKKPIWVQHQEPEESIEQKSKSEGAVSISL